MVAPQNPEGVSNTTKSQLVASLSNSTESREPSARFSLNCPHKCGSTSPTGSNRRPNSLVGNSESPTASGLLMTSTSPPVVPAPMSECPTAPCGSQSTRVTRAPRLASASDKFHVFLIRRISVSRLCWARRSSGRRLQHSPNRSIAR